MDGMPNIIIFNTNTEESRFFTNICRHFSSVYPAPNRERLLTLLESTDFDAALIDRSLALYRDLKGMFKSTTSIVITAPDENSVKALVKEWPETIYVDSCISPFVNQDDSSFLRIVRTAVQFSSLTKEVNSLRFSKEKQDFQMKEAFSQIAEIKEVIQTTVVKELENRIAIEAKYLTFKREKQKIEKILKKLYMANDVTSLLDIVFDIKEIIQARGISIYILDENDTLGRFLKPLVWDNTILSHPDISKHIVLIDSPDFAASVASHFHEINLSDINYDKRMSNRYIEQLRSPLKGLLSLPIMHDKEVIGVLEVYNKEKQDNPREKGFSKEDQKLLRQLSEHISIAITKLNLIQYDALTGLLRPDSFFDKVIQKIKTESKRKPELRAYALVMGDVDWFKIYNDRHGHEAGNNLLRKLSSILKSSIRDEDLLCRYGGEEFLFFLTGIKNAEEASLFTERIRKSVEEHYFEHQEFQPKHNLTMSFGITTFSKERFDSIETISKNHLLKIANEADMALSEAKGKGSIDYTSLAAPSSLPDKNRICVFQPVKAGEPQGTDTIVSYEESRAYERRQYYRHYTSNVLIYKSNGVPKVAKTVNLSMGGTKVGTNTALSSDQTYDLVIILGNKAFQCQGDIVYSKKKRAASPFFHSGFKFKNLPSKDKQVLENYFLSLTSDKTDIPD